MIIDSHAHIGFDYVFDEQVAEQSLIDANLAYGIDLAIVQPLLCRPYIDDTIKAHDQVHSLCKRFPGRFAGMASINPHFRSQDYDREATRCINELGFVGLKITPIGHAIHPSTTDGMHVFEVARTLKVPVMVHTGAGIPFADPVNVTLPARTFTDVKIIIAHAGTDMFFTQALELSRAFDNVYLEPSWLSILNLKYALKVVGASKIMFSSDDPLNVPIELVKYRTAITDPEQLNQVFAGTAQEVFNRL